MKSKQLTIIIVVIAVILIITGLFLFAKGNKNTKELTYEDFTITSHIGEYKEYDKSLYVEGYKGSYDYAYYITGMIKSEKKHGFTTITFDLYDKNDKLLGTAVAGLNSVNNSETKFTALSLIDSKEAKKVVSYELKEIK